MIWKAGWHFTCDDCDEDSSASGTAGYATKAEAQAYARQHRRECSAVEASA